MTASGWKLAPIAIGLSACMLSPTDDGRVASSTAPLSFWGYLNEPDRSVQVRAWNFSAHAMANVGLPVRSTTTPTSVEGGPLYSWSASRPLTASFWQTGPAGGQCAAVGARATLGSGTHDVITVESNWEDCYADNPSAGEFYTNCASSNSPVAKIYTTSWGTYSIGQSVLDAAGPIASSQIALTLDNYQPVAYAFCNSSNPAGCPAGHSDDPETYKYFNPNASSITRTGSPTVAFSITPSRRDPMTIYLDNMSSSSFDFGTDGARFVIGINFESAGTEIRMNCIRNIACAFVDGRTIELAGPRAVISLELAVQNGRVVYTDAVATFTTTTATSDAASAAAAISDAMTDKLNDEPAIRNAVGAAIDSVLRQTSGLNSMWPIDTVSISSGIVRVRPGCPLS